MLGRTGQLLGVALATTLWLAAPASADVTIGTATEPPGTSTNVCNASNATYVQTGSESPLSYVVPSGGQITSWSTGTQGSTAGATVKLVVLQPATGGDYTVLAVDAETLPNPLPPSNVATFTPAAPIPVSTGDTIAINAPTSSVTCFWNGSLSSSDTIDYYASSNPPAAGQTLTPFEPGTNRLIDVSAVVTQRLSVSVTTNSAPASPSAGNLALLASTVTNKGPNTAPITFTDNVPAGLAIDLASAGGGACAVSGQTVTCTIANLAVGASEPVDVVVTTSRSGSYTNTVAATVPPGLTNTSPTPTASTILSVIAPPSIISGCIVPKLRGISGTSAKGLLKLLGCQVKVKKKKHKGHGVAKGSVLKSKPGAGTYAFGRQVTLIVRK